jgi:ATP-dependent RNA helicase DeaD
MQRYRIEVGREHNVQPKHIVGAIANEANIDSSNIGHIRLYDTFSTVDLPQDLSRDAVQHLKKVWVCGQQLHLSPADERGGEGRKPRSGYRKSGNPSNTQNRSENRSDVRGERGEPRRAPRKRPS